MSELDGHMARARSWARALQLIGLALTMGALVAYNALLRRDLHALDVRIAKLENLANPEPPTPQETQRWEASVRSATEAQERRDDAITTCRRQLGQVAVMGFGYRVVCIQAPSVAFELDPDWPQ